MEWGDLRDRWFRCRHLVGFRVHGGLHLLFGWPPDQEHHRHRGQQAQGCAEDEAGQPVEMAGANFPMTAALVADYYGENNNAVNYGSIYAFKALGGSFAGGLAALVMTGTLYGAGHFHWLAGFIFGASLGLLATVTVVFLVRRPTEQHMQAAVHPESDEVPVTKPAIA